MEQAYQKLASKYHNQGKKRYDPKIKKVFDKIRKKREYEDIWECLISKNYYSILGVKRGASIEEVKRTHLCCFAVKGISADSVTKAEIEEKSKEIAKPFEVLSDPEKKSDYDQFGILAEVIGQDKPGQLDEALGKLPPRWKNW